MSMYQGVYGSPPPKPLGSLSRSDMPYPRFTKLSVAESIVALPDHSAFQQGSPTANASNGFLFVGCIDLDQITKSDGTPAIATGDRLGRYYYLLSSDHTTGNGGLWLAYGDSPRGPLTLYSDSPLLDATALSAGTQLESARNILWNSALQKFVIFPHVYRGSSTPQSTVRLVSDDLLDWDVDEDAEFVLEPRGDHGGYGAAWFVDGELRLNARCEGAAGMLWGQYSASDAAWKHWSLNPGSLRPAHPHPFADEVIDEDWYWMNVPQPFWLGGRVWGSCSWRESATHGTRNDSIYIAPMDREGFCITGGFRQAVAKGAGGAWDAYTVHAETILQQPDGIYLYYCGIDSSFEGGLGVAKCTIYPDGSYDHL